MAPKVLTERRERTFVVTINRPDVRNCVDGETAGLLFEAVEAFRADGSLDVLILTGAGSDAFCSGADLKNVGSLGARSGARDSGPMGISRITDLPKPAIAAVEGYCTAGGLELACWCDFRVASQTAQFGVLNRRWGVPLVDGGTQRLPRIVGPWNAPSRSRRRSRHTLKARSATTAAPRSKASPSRCPRASPSKPKSTATPPATRRWPNGSPASRR